MQYLEETLNLKVKYEPWNKAKQLPYVLADSYQFKSATLDTLKTLFVYPVGPVEPISTVKKQFSFIKKLAGVPLVLVLPRCTARQRNAMIAAGIAFIVENQQIYLPFLGVLLQEKFTAAETVTELSPSAQLLLFYYIYSGAKELPMNDVVQALEISAMSVSRAVRQLEEIGLISTFKQGVAKIITADAGGKDLYANACPYLRSPIKKIVYIEKDVVQGNMCKAGYTALAELSMLNSPRMLTFAADSSLSKAVHAEADITDVEEQCCVEIWKYNPLILAKNGCVDVLSLHQALKNDQDERVQGEIDDLLQRYWEESND